MAVSGVDQSWADSSTSTKRQHETADQTHDYVLEPDTWEPVADVFVGNDIAYANDSLVATVLRGQLGPAS